MATKSTKGKPAKRAIAVSIARPELKKGEEYIGAILGADGKGHHIILLAGESSGTWQSMMEWAKKQGGDLPDRVEQALLFRDHKAKFKAEYYWSNTQHAGNGDYAWGQGFADGTQYGWHKGNSLHGRAVRRVAI